MELIIALLFACAFFQAFGTMCIALEIRRFLRAFAVSTTLSWMDESGEAEKAKKVVLRVGGDV